MSRYVWVIVDFPLLTFKLSLECLFSPHHVNQDGVQKITPQVTLYKPHTAKESLRRRRAGRYSQVLPDHTGQTWELLLVLLPTFHQRKKRHGGVTHLLRDTWVYSGKRRNTASVRSVGRV